jgi:hypothetical protein
VPPVLLTVDVVAVLVLVWIAVIDTDDEGHHASPIHVPLTLVSAASTAGGFMILHRAARPVATLVGIVLMLVAPTVLWIAPSVSPEAIEARGSLRRGRRGLVRPVACPPRQRVAGHCV